jgi:hypothetical protein
MVNKLPSGYTVYTSQKLVSFIVVETRSSNMYLENMILITMQNFVITNKDTLLVNSKYRRT